MGHYRGGGVGRIKGFVSQGVGRRVRATGQSPYGDWTGAIGEPHASMGIVSGENLDPPPAHTSRASARAAPGQFGDRTHPLGGLGAGFYALSEAHRQLLRPIEEEGTGPFPRFLAEPSE